MKHTWFWISTSLLALALTACGGNAVEQGGGGGAAGSGTGGGTAGSGGSNSGGSGGNTAGSGGGYVGGCPETAPTGGSSCSTTGLACSYGDSFDPMCRHLFTCSANGTWTQSPTSASCDEDPAPDCPATMPANKSECDKNLADNNTTCRYPDDKSRCACRSTDCSGGPCQIIDPPAWICHGPPSDPKCPSDMPNAGTSCSAPDLKCPYMGGGCAGGWTLKCVDGAWTVADEPCPV